MYDICPLCGKKVKYSVISMRYGYYYECPNCTHIKEIKNYGYSEEE